MVHTQTSLAVVPSLSHEAPARDIALVAAQAGLDKKADDVVVVDIAHLATYADELVLLSGASSRQVQAIADGVREALSASGHKPVSMEGYEQGNWVLIDYGDVIVHVLDQETRLHYDLDGLWVDAPQRRLAERHAFGT